MMTKIKGMNVTSTKKGYRQFKSSPTICSNCPFLAQCTESKIHTKLIKRHIGQIM